MSRTRLSLYLFAALIVPGSLGAALTPLVASAPAAAAKASAHHKKHHKKKHHKKKHTPTPSKPKLEGCSAGVNGTGPTGEGNLYAYEVILACNKGEYGSFTVSMNRTIEAGSVTARIGDRYTYTCQTTSSTSFSCSGVNATIPSDEEPAVRALFKSTQPVCVGGAPETATVSTQGETFNATVGEAQGSC